MHVKKTAKLLKFCSFYFSVQFLLIKELCSFSQTLQPERKGDFIKVMVYFFIWLWLFTFHKFIIYRK